MTWTRPTFIEVQMDAGFSAYVDDLARDASAPDEQPVTGMTAPLATRWPRSRHDVTVPAPDRHSAGFPG